MYQDILLPTDGSSGTVDAIEHALTIGSDHDARLHSLYVVDRRLVLAAATDAKDEIVQSLEEAGERALDDVEIRANDAGLSVETEFVEGIPHKEITAYVEDDGIDLVVMGTHGHTGPERVANLGSTTERVLEHADVPVLVVNIQ